MQEKTFSIAKTFDLEGIPEELTVRGLAERSPFVPALDPDYQFRKELLSDLLAWHMLGGTEGLYLTGPTGSGKSTLVTQVAARLNIPVQRVTAHSRLETPELVGHYALVNGSMSFVDGPLTTAMREGHWFLLDEIDLLDPATAAGLNGIVEGSPLVIPEKGGEMVVPAPGFCFIATGNTAGAGDQSGLYQGTMRQNLAFLDRFWMVEVGYPEEEQEQMILARVAPGIPEDIRTGMIAYAMEVRRLFMAGQLEVTLSTRTLVRWAKMSEFFRPLANQGKNPLQHALERALSFRAEPETRSSLAEIAQRIFG
ncbi:CbbQ/NirQ/NorQ/GpvN family protein [Geothermobacter hydrogeniphilus]|uniref:ATPase n=1 Tax=Geothermobacter hydrogeniphilus TaxID=1969733 RepID=A0A1X0Y7Z2_9BACT|nr:CbbQ/NirQ/NorQ/GpvN family protein [Geothermobacter hydrogeniphilus]ORJ61320.1 ATPase [Geothermobacter hydrogeniphilus]